VRDSRWLRPALVLLAGGLALAAGAASCSRPPRSDETDRIAKVVADAISFPRQQSAAGFARAALATRAGQDGRLQVVAMEELEADRPEDPMARLVFSVHLPADEGGWSSTPAVTTCYEARFNHYGIIRSPKRMACPPGATPITPPTGAPVPEVEIPTGADELVERLLTDAARTPSAGEVRAALAAGLRQAADRAGTGPGPRPPEPQVATDGDDIGVALFEPEDRSCLLGARTGGRVTVWRPSRVQLQPGELSCDPGTALAGLGQRAPH
jgi:hypothetical protein